jgi:ligand-binding sensor domain-containing protein
MFHDRDGGLWVGTFGGDIVHFHQSRTDLFSQSDGLTGDNVLSFFEDREGNVWVATTSGLDRFRELPIVTYDARQGLSSAAANAVLGAKDGSVWFQTGDGVDRLNDGLVTIYGSRGARPLPGRRAISSVGMADHRGVVHSLKTLTGEYG